MSALDAAHGDATERLVVETLRGLVVDAATALGPRVAAVHTAAAAGESTGDVFMSAAALELQGNAIRAERAQRVQLLKAGFPPPIGFSAAPAPIRAVHTLAEIRAGLALLERSALEEAVVCRIDPGPATRRRARPVDPTDAELLATVAHLAADIPDADWLGYALDELTAIDRAITIFLDGASAAPVPGLCPHCDRPTLVRHKDEGLIRCESDRSTGRREECVCTQPLDCPAGCQRGGRHEWRQGGTSDEWRRLAGQIRHADDTRPQRRRSPR